jgi:hypothetical protein
MNISFNFQFLQTRVLQSHFVTYNKFFRRDIAIKRQRPTVFLPCSHRWKVMLKSTVCWFVVREKHYTIISYFKFQRCQPLELQRDVFSTNVMTVGRIAKAQMDSTDTIWTFKCQKLDVFHMISWKSSIMWSTVTWRQNTKALRVYKSEKASWY